jgi:hypothetical protein
MSTTPRGRSTILTEGVESGSRERSEAIPTAYRLAIALMGKGSTNHLHRQEVVDALRERGIQVTFLVREDYVGLLQPLPACRYVSCRFHEPSGWKGTLEPLLRHLRSLYPAADPGKRLLFKHRDRTRRGLLGMVLQAVLHGLARYRGIMRLAVAVEGRLFSPDRVQGLDPASVDQLLLLNIGMAGGDREAALTWWARRHGISVVHVVGNYDNLSSAGFRGVPVDALVVWGPSMRDDAVRLHGIPVERVRPIGAIRYNSIDRTVRMDREAFLRSRGLDPAKTTILFAGSLAEFHYFEMLEVLRHLNRAGDRYQLILRVYPNKALMSSVYLDPLVGYASRLPGVYVSLADPHARSGARDREVLQIEETELWHALKHADVIVNLYSTIALEACIFDKPAINMWYFAPDNKLVVASPVYAAFPELQHNRRLAAYGAIRVARSRGELVAAIEEAVRDPLAFKAERQRAVEQECGPLDGRACERLAAVCASAYATRGAATSRPEGKAGGAR